MAKRTKKGTFKKGTSGNAKGRPRLSTDTIRVRNALLEEIAKAGDMLSLTPEQLAKVISTDTPSILVQTFIEAVKKKDWRVIESFLNRILGKPKETIDVKAEITSNLTDDQRKKIAESFLESLQSKTSSK